MAPLVFESEVGAQGRRFVNQRQLLLERDTRAILDAAGVHEPTQEQLQRAMLALHGYVRTLFPQVCATRDKWRQRAFRLRDKLSPQLVWDEPSSDSDATT